MASGMRAFHALLFLQLVTSFCSYSFCDRFDESNYDRTETRGNTTFGCSSSGPCTPCSYSEKSDDETYHCSTTGYRQSYRCAELGSDGSNGHSAGDKASSRGLSSEEISKRGLHESKEALSGWVGRKAFESEDTTMHDARQVLHIYSSCIPTNSDDKLSVLGFEGIVLGLLALSAPLIYHRKRRNFTMTGMSRLPTSSRF
eukprot:c21890_g1_i1 orf=494-1093(-)